MSIVNSEQLSPREHVLMENDNEQARLAREHALNIKKLEIEELRERNQAEIRLRELEAKWRSWLKLPFTLLRLPLFVLLGVAYVFAVCFNYQPVKRFWDLLD